MRCAWMIAPVLTIALGACAAEPANSGAESSAPAGFDAWLAEQCPDGAAVQVGEPGHVVGCERVREKAALDPAIRERLVDVYMGRSAESDVGEAREPLTPLGALLCALIAAAPGVLFNNGPTGEAACHSPHLSHDEQARCGNVTAGGSVALGILCAVAAFF